MGKKFNVHRFFCINCGNEGIPIVRARGFLHESGHRKKLYCPHCQMEINHVECKNDEEVYLFRLEFEEGAYKDEAEESLAYVRNTGLGQINMGSETNI